MTGRRRTRIGRGGLLALVLLALTAGPAAADPPGPTNYDARLVAIEPDLEGVEARVIGGDSFLQLELAEGREALVRGYDDEELYLRFDATGEVYENRRSQTYYQNQSRYTPGAADRPAELGPDVPPDWVLVSTTGSYAWHDHRIHWMSPTQLPFLADPDGSGDARPVDPDADEPQLTGSIWVDPVPITVDGEPVDLVGEVYYLPDASPLPTILAVVLALVGVVALGWRSPAAGVLLGGAGGAIVALAVAVPQVVGLPPGVEAQPLQVVVPLIALGVVAAGLSVRSRSAFAVLVAGAAGIPLLGWVLTNAGGFTAPIVPPGTWPDALVRVAVGLVAGAGLGVLAVGIRDLLAGGALSLDPGPDTSTT